MSLTDSATLTQAKALVGRHIVVTRPADQAGHLAAAITLAGGKTVLFPLLAIHDIEDTQPLLDLVARLDEFDLAVFVSPNAVNKALAIILRQRRWPASLRAAAMGKTSERELARFGITDVIAPSGPFDSEALLELPQMRAMTGQRVVVFRGDGGRDLLGDTLRQRGASVEYVTCYRRGKPDQDSVPLQELWTHDQLDAIVITSSEGLRNLVDLLDNAGRDMLKNTPLFVPHARIVAEALSLGLQQVVPTAPGDAGLLAGLMNYFAESGDGSGKSVEACTPGSFANHGN